VAVGQKEVEPSADFGGKDQNVLSGACQKREQYLSRFIRSTQFYYIGRAG